MIQRMYCHACVKDFNIDIDMQADGNHVFKCFHCKHEHCRVVKNGEITSERWDSRNGDLGMVYYPAVGTSSLTNGSLSLYGYLMSDSWCNTSTAATSTY